MNPLNIKYKSSAYRSDITKHLPTPIRTSNCNSRSATSLSFGHYARLDSAIEITAQLQANEHKIYETKKKTRNRKPTATLSVGASSTPGTSRT